MLINSAHRLSGESRALLNNTQNVGHGKVRTYFTNYTPSPLLVKSLSFGMIGVAFGTEFAGLGKILALLGDDGKAAASSITTLAVFVLGTGVGFISSTGIALGSAEKSDMRRIAMIIRVSWAWCIVLGALFTCVLGLAKYILSPLEKTRVVTCMTSDFFEGFAPSMIPDLLMLANGIAAFQVVDNALMSPVTLGCYRLTTLIVADSLQTHMGAFGTGLACSISAWGGLAISFIWRKYLLGANYKLLQLDSYKDFITIFTTMGIDGAKLALQRVTEWGNMAVITLAIWCFWTSQELGEIQPSVDTLTFINAFTQSYSLAIMMLVKRDYENTQDKIKTVIAAQESSNNDGVVAVDLMQQLTRQVRIDTTNIAKYALTGLLINAGFCIIMCSFYKELTKFFAGASAEPSLLLFLANGVGLLPDGLRILSGGILRGRGDIMIPTMANLVIMTFVGVPMGVMVSKFMWKAGVLPVFVVRAVVLMLSMLFNFYRYYQKAYLADLQYQNRLPIRS